MQTTLNKLLQKLTAMRNTISNLCQQRKTTSPEPDANAQANAADIAQAEASNKVINELAAKLLGLEELLARKDNDIAELRSEHSRDLAQERAKSEARILNTLHNLFSEMAPPALQLMTQDFLLKSQEADLSAEDILMVAKTFVRILQDNGLELTGDFGKLVAFDPSAHATLDNTPVETGTPVKIVCAGASYKGKELRKLSVLPVEESANSKAEVEA